MKRLLIIDDEFAIIHFIKIFFEEKGYEVLTAQTGKEGLEQIKYIPDLILLDVMLPDIDGMELCAQIRDNITCPILFLTAKVEEEDRIKGLMMGGDDYIMKPFSIHELYARVEAHLRRERRTEQKTHVLKRYSDLWIDDASKEIGYGEKKIEFTKTQYEIIKLLMDSSNRVLPKDYIYDYIWGYLAEGDPTVAVTEQVKRIRKKLEFTKKEYIKTVWGIGYRWEG